MFFNGDWENCYEELISWYPVFYREVREMKAVLQAHGRLADGMQAGIEQVFSDAFIDTADEGTISRWEAFLYIPQNSSRTLSERIGLIKAYIIGSGHLSATMIKQMVGAYTGTDVDVIFEPFDDEGNNCLYITIYPDDDYTVSIADILELLARKVPAHIYWLLNSRFEICIDNSSAEQFVLKNITLRMKIPFWGCYIFDGTLNYDGSEQFGQTRRYDLILGLMNHEGGIEMEENALLRLVTVRAEAQLSENAAAGLTAGFAVNFWPSLFFDGGLSYDGSECFCHILQEITASAAVRASAASVSEEFGNATVTETRNLAFFDGSYFYDGSRVFNSIYRKEEI